jgi:hypothetical protein
VWIGDQEKGSRVSHSGANETKLKQLSKLQELERDLLEKLRAVHDERAIILAGGPTMAARLRQTEAAWRVAWAARYAGTWIPNRTLDMPAMKRLLRTFTPADLQPRMKAYLEDEFYVPRRHPFSIFASEINRWAPEGADEPTSAPADCKHAPPCRSDAEHTQRRRAERRAS